jgi:hypothetical protein
MRCATEEKQQNNRQLIFFHCIHPVSWSGTGDYRLQVVIINSFGSVRLARTAASAWSMGGYAPPLLHFPVRIPR